MKNYFVVVRAFVLLAFASVSMAAEKLPQSEVDEIIKGVESGDAEAQLKLGLMYIQGQNVKEDRKQAFYWFKKSYEQGNVEAQFWLAISYWNKGDYTQSFKLSKQVTEKDPSTIKNVHGIEKEGEKIYSSAEELIAVAQYFVGLSYYGGNGVQKDVEQAEYWVKKSLEHGSESCKKEAQETLEKIRTEKAKQSQTSTSSTQPKPSASESVIEIGINQLKKEHRENKIAAKRKYNGKRIRLSGFVHDIDEDNDKNIYISLSETKDDFDFGIRCYFNNSSVESIMNLKEGQSVTIEGTCRSGENMFGETIALLQNSRVVSPNSSSTSQVSERSSSQTPTQPTKTETAHTLQKPRTFDAAKGNAAAFIGSVQDVAEKLMKTEAYKTQDSENNGDENLYMRSWYNDRYFMFGYYANTSRTVASFRTTSPEFIFAGGIKVGTSFNSIRDLFGDFSSWSADSNTFNVNVDMGEVNIHINEDKVDYIEYNNLFAEYTHKMSNLLCLYRGDIYSAGITANGRLNIRDSNGTHGNILFQVTNQNNILFVDNSPKRDSNGNGWYRVRFVYNKSANTISSVNEGYVMGKYINVEPLGYEDRQSLITAFSK